jgi:hypothetical protein
MSISTVELGGVVAEYVAAVSHSTRPTRAGASRPDARPRDAKIALRIGAATVGLHPADAAERGLAEGDADMGRSTAVHSIEVRSHRHVIQHGFPLRRCRTFTECSPSDYPGALRGF